MSEVAEMLRARAANGGQLIESFAQWASDSTALAARKAVLLAILSDPEPSKRLFLLLEAVSRLPIAPEQDPLWRNVVEGVSSMWHPGTIGVARDMLFTQEARPKARQLVISSLVDYTLSGRVAELTKGQKGELANDFIDLHYKLPPAQQSEVQSAVRRLVGDETAEVLRGNTAELERRWKQEMTATKKGLSENAYASPAPAPPAAALDEAGSVPAP